MDSPTVGVILCTYNPKRDRFARALQSIARQSFAADEFVVVDNNSSPPLDADWVLEAAGRPLLIVREPRKGLCNARIAGVRESKAALLCFVDDDNVLAPGYLEEAANIYVREPRLGAYSGVAEGVLEKPVTSGFRHFLPFFGVIDHGAEPLTGAGDRLGLWTPVGAGLCVRRDVADAFVEFVAKSNRAARLGRQGALLMSGEDSLFSHVAHLTGHEVGYRPTLRLQHVIGRERLTLPYLARLMEGHGRSHVLLAEIQGRPVAPPSRLSARAKNALHRLKSHGPMRAFGMYFWDRGVAREEEARRSSS